MSTPAPQRPHVLLVEDSALVSDALRLLLEEHGYSVTTAHSIASARQATTRQMPDVVLLDLALPDGDGLSLVGELAAGAGDRPPVVMALTGHADDETRSRCLDAGCRDVLVKPVTSTDLIRRLTDATG